MNTLEALKERLMIKPTIDKRKQFTIAIKEKPNEKNMKNLIEEKKVENLDF